MSLKISRTGSTLRRSVITTLGAAVLVTAFAAPGAMAATNATSTAATGTAATGTTTPAPGTTQPAPGGWTNVFLHGHWIKVHPHGRFGKVKFRSHIRPRPQPPADGLMYGGGPVAHNPMVFLDFWGSQWDSDQNGVEQYVQSFVSGLGQSDDNWSTITSQYTDSTGAGPAFGGSVLAGTWVDDGSPAPQTSVQADIAAEAVSAAQHFGVNGSDDMQIVVLSPSGTQPDGFPNAGFCAYHDFTGSSIGNVPYTNMPYVLDAGSSCGADSVQSQLDGFSIVEGHEYAETLTDPEPSSGWVDSSGAEIGDKCAWVNLFAIGLSTGSFAMQPLWSNNDDGCAQQAP